MADTKRTILEHIENQNNELFGGFNRAEKELQALNALLGEITFTNSRVLATLGELAKISPDDVAAIVSRVGQLWTGQLELFSSLLRIDTRILLLGAQVQQLIDAGEFVTLTFFVNDKETQLQTLENTQEEIVTLKVTNSRTKLPAVATDLVWTSSDELLATVVVNPGNPLQATVKSVIGNPGGVVQINVDGDADPGTGVRPIHGFITYTINPDNGVATVFELSGGGATEQAA